MLFVCFVFTLLLCTCVRCVTYVAVNNLNLPGLFVKTFLVHIRQMALAFGVTNVWAEVIEMKFSEIELIYDSQFNVKIY